MNKPDQTLLAAKPTSIGALYDGYADMLLGYIFEKVKDKQLAEEYLVKVFKEISLTNFNKLDWNGTNTWCQLLRFAKNQLSAFDDAAEECAPDTTAKAHGPNKYLDKMTEEQKLIFCNFYYHKKTTHQLSKELKLSEDVIRKSLKEAFTIIRTSHGN